MNIDKNILYNIPCFTKKLQNLFFFFFFLNKKKFFSKKICSLEIKNTIFAFYCKKDVSKC